MYQIKLGKLKQKRLDKLSWILASGIINKDVWLAGGALRTIIDQNETIVDYDLFFKTQYGLVDNWLYRENFILEETKAHLTGLGFKCTFECPEGKLYTYEKVVKEVWKKNHLEYNKLKVQLICENFYNSPKELLDTFDLTPCLFTTNGEYLWATKQAILDTKYKKVRLHKLTYPVSTMKRIIKYAKKGYQTNLACAEFVSNLYERGSIKELVNDEMRHYID